MRSRICAALSHPVRNSDRSFPPSIPATAKSHRETRARFSLCVEEVKFAGLHHALASRLPHQQDARSQDHHGESRHFEAAVLHFQFVYTFGKRLNSQVVSLHAASSKQKHFCGYAFTHF